MLPEPVPQARQAPQRKPGDKLVRPRDAATVIIVRRDGPKPRMLMGRRNKGHSFMPNLWVFPGGRIDRADFRAPAAHELRPEVQGLFDAHLAPRRGRALAMAAIRETFEEAGLLLGVPYEPRPAAGPWREFLAHGALPDLSALDILARAVTPPSASKRFDAWFLTADAERLTSLERLPDCGELDEVAWVSVEETKDMPLPMITQTMIKEAVARVTEPDRPKPYIRFHAGAMRKFSL